MSRGSAPGVIRASRVGDLADLAAVAPTPLRRWDGGPGTPATEARVGHDGVHLIVVFRGAYDLLNVDPAASRARPVPRLWERDVVELFVSDAAGGAPYHEIEASPLGQWLTLRFARPRVAADGPAVVPAVDARLGDGELEIVIRLDLAALRTASVSASAEWRLGLFRIAGVEPTRSYLAHEPTGTAVPDFHQPASWARLVLE